MLRSASRVLPLKALGTGDADAAVALALGAAAAMNTLSTNPTAPPGQGGGGAVERTELRDQLLTLITDAASVNAAPDSDALQARPGTPTVYHASRPNNPKLTASMPLHPGRPLSCWLIGFL